MFRKIFAIILIIIGGATLLLGGVITLITFLTGESGVAFFIMVIIFGVIPFFFGLKFLKKLNKKVEMHYEENIDEYENFEENIIGYSNSIIDGLPRDISKITATTKFIRKESTIIISGRKINSPMIYVDSKINKYKLHHVIYINEEIQFTGTDEEIDYSPNYSTISPYSKGKFIMWLEAGKNDIDFDIGLLFIYYYGLEFRAIYDKSDYKDILWEIIRLHNIYEFNNSFKNYSEKFIAWLILSIKDLNNNEKERLLSFANELDLNSELFTSGAYHKLSNNDFNSHNLIHIISTYEKTSNSKIPKKLGKIFYDYFLHKIDPHWPKIIQTVKKCLINFNYYYASPIYALGHCSSAKGEIYTLSGTTKNKLARIWNQCIEDLKPYSRKFEKATENDLFLLLPKELKEIYEHPLANAFNSFASEKEAKPCKISEISEFLKYKYSEKLTLKQSKELCETIAQLGYNIEPDSRYTSKSYKWNDCVIFYKTDTPNIPQNSNYAIASMLFDLGVYISRADTHLDKEELETIEFFIINNFCSNEKDIKRIINRSKLAEAGFIKGIGIAKKLANHLKVRELKKIGSYLFMVAAADGIIDKSELKAINKIFNDFGLDNNFLNITLDEYRAKVIIEDSTKIRHGNKICKTGSLIPKPQLNQQQDFINIDSEKLKAIIKDTEDVKQILKDVFSDEEQNQEIEPISVYKNELPKTISEFLNKIIQKDNWTKTELRKLAIENKIMIDSAVEQINYWYEEETGKYLILEKEEDYFINKKVLIKT